MVVYFRSNPINSKKIPENIKICLFLDVSRFDGSYEHVFETTTAGVTIQAPQLDVSTVAGKKKNLLEVHFDEIFCD